jgi:hypothetical protein
MNSKIIYWVLGFAILLFLALFGYYSLNNNQVTNEAMINTPISNDNSNNVDTAQPEPIPTNTNSNTPPTNTLTYKSEKYGFQMTLRPVWDGYITNVKTSGTNYNNPATINFCLPAPDGPSSVQASDCGKSGYSWALAVDVFTKSQWKTYQQDTQTPAHLKPVYLGENSEYVFSWAMWQDPPASYANTNLGYGPIIDTFKALR